MKRSISALHICVSAGVLASSAWGQLYLVTGSQSSKSPEGSESVLLQVSAAGELREVGEIAPPSVGTWLIEISYDERKLVAFSPGYNNEPKSQTVVVDFNKGGVVKKCSLPEIPAGYVAIAEWLANVRDTGFSMLEQSVASDPLANKGVISAMSINTSAACDTSFKTIPPADIKSIITNGQAGVAGVALNENVPFAIDRDGKIIKRFAGGDILYLGYQVPEKYWVGLNSPGFSVMINNSRVLATVIGGWGTEKTYRLVALRKSDQTWHSVPISTEVYPSARSFDHYLALSEAHVKTAESPESAGRAEWRKASGKMGPSISGRLLESNLVYPGRLHLYDIDSERVYTIETKQGDSEVLLVEDGTVYYRASDRLYSAPISNAGIGATHLIATNEAIRDAHWAFIKY